MRTLLKNILMLLVVVIALILMYFTMLSVKNTATVSNNVQTPISGNMETPPAKPEGDTNFAQGTPPALPFGNKEDMVSLNQTSSKSLSGMYYIVFISEGLIFSLTILYLAMSRLNKKLIKETFVNKDKVLIYFLASILLTTYMTVFNVYVAKTYFLTSSSVSQGNQLTQGSQTTISSIAYTASTTIDNETKTLTSAYSSSNSNENVILVKNNGNVALENATVNKTSGDTTNTEFSDFYGVNAGVLATAGSIATIKDTTITTAAKGGNAVFSTGTDSKIYINDSTINTTGSSSSRGLDATNAGYIEADNVKITTQGGSSATLATDRGGGTIIVKNSNLETNGAGSPIIYSTGDISLTNSTGNANGAQTIVIEGKNSATITNSKLFASGKGNRNDVDNSGVMIYQSMSGDASEGTGTLTAIDSTLEIMSGSSYYKTAPMFFVTNTNAIINLTSTTLNFGSNLLLSVKGTSEWGNIGSNGGVVTFNATNQNLAGNIELDNLSTLTLNLNKSSYTGAINSARTAKSIVLTLDVSSKIKLTGDSYVSTLNDADSIYSNIDFNGYKLYVNGTAIN